MTLNAVNLAACTVLMCIIQLGHDVDAQAPEVVVFGRSQERGSDGTPGGTSHNRGPGGSVGQEVGGSPGTPGTDGLTGAHYFSDGAAAEGTPGTSGRNGIPGIPGAPGVAVAVSGPERNVVPAAKGGSRGGGVG
ncbi:unnamed protein product, partial [Lymnaea stagnalis]